MSKRNELKQTFRNMSLTELKQALLAQRKLQFNMRLKAVSGALEKTHLITEARKTIARIKTIMTEKAGNSHAE